MTPKEVIARGHARSTVYQIAKQIVYPDTSEVAELKEKKAILKLKADIEDIESKREKLPGRVERLEKQISQLAEQLDYDVKTISDFLFALRDIMLHNDSDKEYFLKLVKYYREKEREHAASDLIEKA